jgi:hypothetical protein
MKKKVVKEENPLSIIFDSLREQRKEKRNNLTLFREEMQKFDDLDPVLQKVFDLVHEHDQLLTQGSYGFREGEEIKLYVKRIKSIRKEIKGVINGK